MKPAEYLALCGEITGLDRNQTKRRSAELLSLVGIETANKRIGGFSRGMKQRLGIAQEQLYNSFSALKIHPNKVEVLEPTLESLFMEVVT